MSRFRQLAAWGQLVVGVAATLAGFVLFALAAEGVAEGLAGVPYAVTALTASALGALVLSRRPEHVVGVILAVVGVSAGVTLAGAGLAEHRLASVGQDALTEVATWVSAVIGPIPFHLVGVPLLLFFPNGRLPGRGWRWVAIPALAAVGLSLLATAFAPGALPESGGIENPFGLTGQPWQLLPTIAETAFTAVLIAILVSVASVVVRYRHAGPQERLQIRWMAYAAGLLVLAIIAGNVLAATGISGWESDGVSIPVLLVSVGIAAIPAAAGIAVLRYRLYEIDRIISRTVGYTSLTALLLGVYATLVLVGQRLVGPADAPDWLIAAATLVVAGLFRPLQTSIQRGVDRRFNRARCDGNRVVERLARQLRDELQLEEAARQLSAAAEDALEPAFSAVWLRGRPEPDRGTIP